VPAKNLLLPAALIVPAALGLSACSGNAGDPGSARDVAVHAGCSDIQKEPVPAAWSTYAEAVTCSLKGTRVAVYWSSSNDQAQECLDDDPAKCAEAMHAFRPAS
jgi:hypothetical protein